MTDKGKPSDTPPDSIPIEEYIRKIESNPRFVKAQPSEQGFIIGGAKPGSDDLTSAGVPWSEITGYERPDVEWMDGRHGPAKGTLPSVDEIPIPEVLLTHPVLHAGRPTGSKPMIDVHGAKQRLANCRSGAWLISPYTGWRWAKWPNGEVGWLSADMVLPDELRVPSGD